jgi:hypothetical protein
MGLRGPQPKPKPPPKPKGPGSGRWGSGPIQCNTCNHEERARIDYLLATGSSSNTIGAQYGLTQQNVAHHFRNHVSDRFKRMCRASRLESFEELLKQATEANGETLDLLNLLVRGHAQRWGIALERGEDVRMSMHAGRVLAAIELRSKITLELQPEARNVTVNNYLMRDAAQLVSVLRDHPDAIMDIENWYQQRLDTLKMIDHEPEAADD